MLAGGVMEPEPFAAPVRNMLPILAWAAAGLAVVFVILALARLWGWRTQQRGGGCGGIDLDRLRRQLMAGEISRQEYDAVRARIAGTGRHPAGGREGAPDAEPDPESSIETDGPAEADAETPDDPSERSRTDGQA